MKTNGPLNTVPFSLHKKDATEFETHALLYIFLEPFLKMKYLLP